MGLVIFLLLNLMSPYARSGRVIYRYTLRPFSPPGDGNPPGSRGSAPGIPDTPVKPTAPSRAEKPKSDESSKGSKTLETTKPNDEGPRITKKQNKLEDSGETKMIEGLKKTGSRTSLQDAIEEIHKRVALDEIQKRVARRGGTEKRAPEGPSSPPSPQGPAAPPSSRGPLPGTPGSATRTGSSRETGTAAGAGTGTGTGSGGSPWGASLLESKLNNYYSLIWAKIKEGWTLPEDLPRGRANLEAIIVIVIEKGGKIQKAWFEKKSGNALYDQMAMRAIRKAEPFPSFPKELSDDSLEIGIRFYPE
jgi:TonB family protein